ncbi:PucR family transcriptional regulator [Microbacterium sp. NPDC056052]|uniref:PucR family transcriptional regulator n=1 Tax=Microbacterium sp. NPDC056052 TaxID=3345695 RepID=UPI0035E3ACD8
MREEQPALTLREVLANVHGSAITMLVPGRDAAVRGLSFWDGAPISPGRIVLAPGVIGEAERCAALRTASRQGAVGLVLDPPAQDRVRDVASECGLLLAERVPSLAWDELAAVLRERIALPSSRSDRAPGESLFALADAIAALLGAAVTIEDIGSRVLAFSSEGGELDAVRMSTILSRRVPDDFISFFRTNGALRRIMAGTGPFVTETSLGETRPRLVIPLRVGVETLGSVWVMRDSLPDDELSAALKTLTHAAALTLLRWRMQEQGAREHHAASVKALLRGDPPSGRASLAGMALPALPWRAVALRNGTGPAADVREDEETLGDEVALWTALLRRNGWAEPVIAIAEGAAIAVLGAGSHAGGWDWLRAIVSRTLPADGVTVAAGRAVAEPEGLPTSVSDAVHVLRAGHTGIVSYDDVWPALAVGHAMTALLPWVPAPPIELSTEPTVQERDLLRTLNAWLDAEGDIPAAARALRIHPNTVRLRLTKLRARTALDLTTPDSRLVTHLWARAELARLETPTSS